MQVLLKIYTAVFPHNLLYFSFLRHVESHNDGDDDISLKGSPVTGKQIRLMN